MPIARSMGRRAWLRHARLALMLVVTMLFSTLGSASAEEFGSIGGRVLTLGARNPIEGAHVTVDGDSAGVRTDAAGVFHIGNVRPGNRVLWIRALGRESIRRTVRVMAGQVAQLDVDLAEQPLLMPDVVVSANREAVRKAEVPANVGVVGGDDIREAKPHHPSEIVGRVPGVLVVDLGGEGHTVAMRQPINYSPVYAYLEDGVPIRSTGFFNHNALYEINIPEADRIEVFKGPGTALYGSDAIGGIVNVLTRAPSQSPSLELFAEGGRFGYGRGLATASNTWGTQGVRADLNVTHFDGWRDGTEQDRQSGTLRHDWRIGERARLKTVVTTSWIDSPGDGGSDVSRADFDSRATVNYTPIAYRRVEAIRVTSGYEREVGPWMWNATGYARHNRLQLLPSWQLTYDPQAWDSKNQSLGLMLKARRSFTPARASVIAGADLDVSPGSRIIDGIVPSMTGPIFTSYTTAERQYDYDVTFSGVSPYVEASASPVERLHVTGGLRYDHIGYDYDTHLSPLDTGSHRRPASTRVTFDHVTPSVGATWEFNPETNAFVSYRQGFRVPSEDQLFVQGSALSTVDLDPVRADSYETGLRARLGSYARVEASVYRMDIHDDILSFFNTTDFTSETSNAGRSRHWGVELGVDSRFSDLRLELSYSYGGHRYLEWVTATGVDYSGNDQESAPRDLVNGRVTYAPARWSRSSVSVEWVHVGEYFTDPDNDHTYEGFDLVNAYGRAPLFGTVALAARLNNVADSRYANTASFNPFVPVELRERFLPGQPRSLFIGLQAAWGAR